MGPGADLVADLHAEVVRLREAAQAGAFITNQRHVNAFQDWFRQAASEGRPPDALVLYIKDEATRFKSMLLYGADDHIYWNGGKRFQQNDGYSRKPLRWLWGHTHEVLERTTDIWVTCGEPNCINPAHAEVGRSSERSRYTEEYSINALKVAALQLGHTPTREWWRKNQRVPSTSLMVQRFGSWNNAIAKAGLAPNPHGVHVFSRSHVIAGVMALAEKLGRMPSSTDYQQHREWVKTRGFPASHNTAKKRMGVRTWDELLHVIAVGEATDG